MTFSPSTLVADVVLEHPECALVFRAHKIDFCCGGRIPLTEAAAQRGLTVDALTKELDSAVASRIAPPPTDLRSLDTPALLEHIKSRHHAYLRRTLPVLVEMSAKVGRVHGDHDPALRTVATIVDKLARELLAPLDREEKVIFPYFMSFHATKVIAPALQAELDEMQNEHLAVGAALSELRSLTRDYIVPSWACATYRTMLSELANCETDTHLHVHLENNVLVQRVNWKPTAAAQSATN